MKAQIKHVLTCAEENSKNKISHNPLYNSHIVKLLEHRSPEV